MIRWLLFFFVGIPFQLITYILYPFVFVWFWFFVRGKAGEKFQIPPPKWTLDEMIDLGKQDQVRDTVYLNNLDTHNALTHLHFWILRPELAYQGLKNLIQGIDQPIQGQGCVKRRGPNPTPGDDILEISGDCLSAWVISYVLFGGDKEDVRRLATHYLKNCFGLGCYNNNWQVSCRSSNSGVNYCFDATYGINQPAIGPQYFTSAALLKLTAKELGWKWNLLYLAHYWIMGGWLFTFSPIMYLPSNHFYYSQQITMLNLYSLSALSGNPLYKWSMRYIFKYCQPFENVDPLIYCWAAKAGGLSKDEIQQASDVVRTIRRSFPQNEPLDNTFFTQNLDSQFNSITGAAAKLLKDARGTIIS